MGYELTFEIPILPKTPNSLLGAHWKARMSHSRKWKKLVGHQIIGNKPREPLKKATLTFIRFSSRSPDFDGLSGSFKSVMDALVFHDVLEDDTPEVVGSPTYKWEKCPPKQGKISVTIKGEQ